MYTQIKVERTDLYEKVWARPIAQIAEEYGVSEKSVISLTYLFQI